MNYTIRASTAADLSFLWEMLYQALYVPAGSPAFPREILQQPEISQYLDNWGRPDDFACVAEVEGQSVGAAWLRLLQNGYGYVHRVIPELTIAVSSPYRGSGVGTALLTALLAHARNRYTAVSLSVSVDNPALRLYERLGFEVLQTTGASLVMRKLL